MTFIPYQVDHTNQNVSKTLGFSKKRVSFKFGLANPVALAEGKTGAQCRGSEHEIVFVWSLKSGKRWLYLDGKEIHFSESGMNGWTVDRAWQHAFPLRDSTGSSFKMHFVSQPVNKEIPDCRPFDLRINGTSYFNFNEIWKLGTPAMTARDSPSRSSSARSPRHRGGDDAYLSPEERRQIAAAKLESLRDIAEQKAAGGGGGHAGASAGGGGGASTSAGGGGMKREEESLISFDNDPVPPPQIQNQQQMERARSMSSGAGSGYFHVQPNPSSMSSMTMDPNDFGHHHQQQPYMQQPPVSYGGVGMPGTYGGQQSYPPQLQQQQQGPPPPPPPNPFTGVLPAPASAPVPAGTGGSMFDPMAGSGASQSSSTAMTPYVYPSPQQQQQQQQQAPPMYGGGGVYGQQQQPPPPQQQPYNPSSSVGGGLPPQFGSPGGQSMHSYASYGSAPSFAQPPPPPPQQQSYYTSSPGGGPPGGGVYAQPPPPSPGQGYPPQAPPPGQGYPPQQQQQPYY